MKPITNVVGFDDAPFEYGHRLSEHPSLEVVVVVAHGRPEIEVVRREADGTWSRCIASVGQSARLTSIAFDLAVAEIYRDPLAGG